LEEEIKQDAGGEPPGRKLWPEKRSVSSRYFTQSKDRGGEWSNADRKRRKWEKIKAKTVTTAPTVTDLPEGKGRSVLDLGETLEKEKMLPKEG